MDVLWLWLLLLLDCSYGSLGKQFEGVSVLVAIPMTIEEWLDSFILVKVAK